MATRIYKAQSIRDWDQFTIKNEPIKSIDLMERAATICVESILERNTFKSVSIFCGVGNNGGDGLVIARLLAEINIEVNVIVLEFSNAYSKDFSVNLKRLPKSIKPLVIKSNMRFQNEIKTDLIIDAIFGSGLTREIDMPFLVDCIQQINRANRKVISIDFPSGLFCFDNSLNSLGTVIEANETYTFQVPKMPFFFSRYEKNVGEFKILDIGLHGDFKESSNYAYIDRKDIHLIPKSKFSHKGTNGHVLLIGGFDKMYGAITLSAKAAYRSGAGYVYVKMNPDGHTILLNHVLEAVIANDVQGIGGKLKALGIGPGLGQSDAALEILRIALEMKLPMVIDADALNLLASNQELLTKLPIHSILTPHVKELERLIGRASSEEKFLDKQIQFSKKHRVFVIQKGAYSKLTCPDGKVYINSTGNEGMAVAGMGDALTGIIAGLLAQGYSSLKSAQYGMLIHGVAGDVLKKDQGTIGMMPADLINILPIIFNNL